MDDEISGLETLFLMTSLNNKLNLKDLFDIQSLDTQYNSLHLKYTLTGMICYSGAHYLAYFKNHSLTSLD